MPWQPSAKARPTQGARMENTRAERRCGWDGAASSVGGRGFTQEREIARTCLEVVSSAPFLMQLPIAIFPGFPAMRRPLCRLLFLLPVFFLSRAAACLS